LTDNDESGTVEIDESATAFAAKKQSPLGTFAGGIFFGARGVVLSNWVSGDENSFKLTDTRGNARERPVSLTLEISNLVGTDETTITDDRVAMFRLTGSGGSIDKTEYSAVGGEAIGDNTLVVDAAITGDTPGKTTGGVLRIRDESDDNKEYRIRYSSWATSTFTLANIVIPSADSGTNPTTIVEAGAFGSAKRGDIVVNHDRAEAVSYVVSVDSANQVTIFPAISGQTQTDSIELNCIPVVIDTLDDVFVPLIDQYAAAVSASVSIVYQASEIFYRVVVRNVAASPPDGPIVPFATDDSTTGTDRSVATIRTIDAIYV